MVNGTADAMEANDTAKDKAEVVGTAQEIDTTGEKDTAGGTQWR
ncbi:hypothetical protein PF003_g11639 [Phytophthora fragariae]|nr:hypothetical protein PF003_g11639 [Phytophthora fragariae]